MKAKRKRKTDHMLEFASVVEWMESLRPSGVSHDIRICTSTRDVYLFNLTAFNAWLSGREFNMRVLAAKDDKIIHKNVKKSFANVEILLHFGEDGNGSAKEIRKIIIKYLNDPMHDGKAQSTKIGMCAAIKSYFDTHDVMTGVKYTGRERRTSVITDAPEMSLPDFYKMITISKIDHLVRAVMLVKLQAGLDRSTLADRFNFYAYKQISEFCGTTNHREWSLDKCPIPLKLMRVKTDYAYITFIDRDALSALKDYLAWREDARGPHDPDGPIFLTNKNKPVSIAWISDVFARIAKYARTQKRLGLRTLKITSHEVRDLLKTTMLACGCKPYAADYFLGHKPKDSYEKPDLYPENLRKEYAKASKVLNMFSHVEGQMDNIAASEKRRANKKRLIETITNQREKIRELNRENRELNRENRELDMKNNTLQTNLKALQKETSSIGERAGNMEDMIKEIAGQAVGKAVSEAFDKRNGDNQPAGDSGQQAI